MSDFTGQHRAPVSPTLRPQNLQKLTTSESLLLDVVRVSAAILVVVGHLSQSFFSRNWPDLTPIARASVAVFFVLSGFVIRYVTCRRGGTLGNYLMDRATRLYSVVLPALVLTSIFDTFSRSLNPAFYAFWAADATHPIARVLTNLFFGAQLWTLDVSPLSNSAFWSLNYEVAYYLLYGAAFYLQGRRRVLTVLVIALIVGPKILLLLPVWLLGCLAHDLYMRWNTSAVAVRFLDRMLAATLAVGAILVIGVHGSTSAASYLFRLRVWLYIEAEHLKLGFTGGVLPFFTIGLFGTLVLLRSLQLVRTISLSEESWWVKGIRFFAEGTFPIYVLHFPLLVFIAATFPYDYSNPAQKLAVFSAVIFVGVLAGPLCNRLRNRMRSFTHTFALGRKPEPGTT